MLPITYFTRCPSIAQMRQQQRSRHSLSPRVFIITIPRLGTKQCGELPKLVTSSMTTMVFSITGVLKMFLWHRNWRRKFPREFCQKQYNTNDILNSLQKLCFKIDIIFCLASVPLMTRTINLIKNYSRYHCCHLLNNILIRSAMEQVVDVLNFLSVQSCSTYVNWIIYCMSIPGNNSILTGHWWPHCNHRNNGIEMYACAKLIHNSFTSFLISGTWVFEIFVNKQGSLHVPYSLCRETEWSCTQQ